MLSEQEIEELKGKAEKAIQARGMVELLAVDLLSLISALEEARKRGFEAFRLAVEWETAAKKETARAEAAEAALKEAQEELSAARRVLRHIGNPYDATVEELAAVARAALPSPSGNPSNHNTEKSR